MDVMEFFQQSARNVELEKFKYKIEKIPTSNEFEAQRNNLIRLVVGNMASAPSQWDLHCQINIKWIGDRFISRVSDNSFNITSVELDDLCSMCFRFLFELYLSTKDELSIDFERAKKFVFDNIEKFEPNSRDSINYAIRDMPISIFKMVSNSSSIESIKNLGFTINEAEKLMEKWGADISSKEKRVDALKDALSRYENAYNFVGLHQGFDDLAQQKTEEKNSILFWMKCLSVLIVLPIVFELIFVYMNLERISDIKDGLILSIFPMISLAAISIYYFRVLLFNYKSVKSQLLQIDLRKTLCRFIQSYSSYSIDIKKKDASSLDKFENIIFSGLVTQDGDLPSTFDGIDQIGKLIKSIK